MVKIKKTEYHTIHYVWKKKLFMKNIYKNNFKFWQISKYPRAKKPQEYSVQIWWKVQNEDALNDLQSIQWNGKNSKLLLVIFGIFGSIEEGNKLGSSLKPLQ